MDRGPRCYGAPDRDARVGLRERGGVVDPITDHGNELSLVLQSPNLQRLILGQHFGGHSVDADLAGSR